MREDEEGEGEERVKEGRGGDKVKSESDTLISVDPKTKMVKRIEAADRASIGGVEKPVPETAQDKELNKMVGDPPKSAKQTITGASVTRMLSKSDEEGDKLEGGVLSRPQLQMLVQRARLRRIPFAQPARLDEGPYARLSAAQGGELAKMTYERLLEVEEGGGDVSAEFGRVRDVCESAHAATDLLAMAVADAEGPRQKMVLFFWRGGE